MIDKDQLREAKKQIRRVLMEQWDPIGISKDPEAQDEYDAYLGGVYRLLAHGASEGEIVKHLRAIEHERMGLRGAGPGQLAQVARSLQSLEIGPTAQSEPEPA